MNAICILENKDPSCCGGRPTVVPPISVDQRPTSGGGKKAISQSDCNPIHAMVMLLNRTLKSTLWHDTIFWRTSVMAAGSNIAFKIAAKPLQIETWLLLTAYRKSPSSCPTVSSLTLTTYCLATVHGLRTDRRQTDLTKIRLCKFACIFLLLFIF